MTSSKRMLAVGGVALALSILAGSGMPRRAIPATPRDAIPPSEEVADAAAEPFGPRADEADLDAMESWREPYFPYLDDEVADASVSIGNTTHGWVVNAKRLTESDACAILPKQRERDLAYGTSDLVDLIEHAAAALRSRTGTRLWVGNIGQRGGGDIAWSVSHNSGRDADIALSYLDASGHPIDPPDLIPLDAKGLAKTGGYRFDVARTWIVVKSLLGHPGAQIQYLFLSEPLKKKLLAYARAQREPATLIQRADDVVHQPWGSLSHNDHLHLRIYCSERDVEGGCHNFGLVHGWVKLHEDARDKRVGVALAKLAGSDADQRKRAIDRLALLGAQTRADDVAHALEDASDPVRGAAARALGALGEARHAPALAARFARESEVAVKVAILGALRDLGGAPAGDVLARSIGTAPRECLSLTSSEPEVLPASVLVPELSAEPTPAGVDPSCLGDVEAAGADAATLRLAAIDAAGLADRLEPVDPLLALLSDPDPQLRGRAAGALARVTNRSFGEHWDEPAQDAMEHDDAVASWRKWIDLLRRYNRDAWVASGFTASGYRVPRIDKGSAWELVRASARSDYLAYNAHRAMMRIADHRPDGVLWSDSHACHYWLGWFGGHRKQLELTGPPNSTVNACR